MGDKFSVFTMNNSDAGYYRIYFIATLVNEEGKRITSNPESFTFQI